MSFASLRVKGTIEDQCALISAIYIGRAHIHCNNFTEGRDTPYFTLDDQYNHNLAALSDTKKPDW